MKNIILKQENGAPLLLDCDENFMEGNVVSRLNHGQTLRILVLEVVASNISNSSGKSMTEIIYAK
jgi:hypothetical protein